MLNFNPWFKIKFNLRVTTEAEKIGFGKYFGTFGEHFEVFLPLLMKKIVILHEKTSPSLLLVQLGKIGFMKNR